MAATKQPVKTEGELIVGIDYGTTYSGISFAYSNAADFKDITPWTKYPGSGAHNNEHCQKAPSIVAFSFENEDLDENVWGYQVESDMLSCSWTKLLLDDSALATQYDDPTLTRATGRGLMRLPPGKTAEDVATAYFKGLYTMFDKQVRFLPGAQNLDSMTIEYWLTVPATWTEKAKRSTISAAQCAGFGQGKNHVLNLIPEPEAAAHFALKQNLHCVSNFVEVGTGVLVCDAGGGTVDITSYAIEESSPSLKLREICVGAGGKCGGSFLERNLIVMLSERFGKVFEDLPIDVIGPGSKFMNSFECIKRDFSKAREGNRRPMRLPLGMLDCSSAVPPGYDRRTGDVLLTFDDMKKLFDPVIEKVLKLVHDQVVQVTVNGEPEIETIVLVGGLGSSPYLREELLEWCTAGSRDIRLATPPVGAWSAVVCGAVLRGVEGSIIRKKKCRRHYGFAWALPYDAQIHQHYDQAKRDRYTNKFNSVEYLTGFMNWVCHKGAEIDDKSSFEASCVITIDVPISIAGITQSLRLYSCSLDDAPKTIESGMIEKVGSVSFTVTDMSAARTKTVKGGKRVQQLDVTVKVQLGDERGVLSFKVCHNGVEVGRADLNFSHSC